MRLNKTPAPIDSELIGAAFLCIEIFLGADQEQSLSPSGPWPAIQLYELSPEHETTRMHFSKPYVYRVSTPGDGCSCFFKYGPHDLEEYARTEGDFKKIVWEIITERCELVKLIGQIAQAAASKSGASELYSCWWNELKMETASYHNVRLDHFTKEQFSFTKRELLTCVSESYQNFSGSFTSLTHQILDNEDAYIHSVVHDDEAQLLTIHFSREPELIKICTSITFSGVKDYISETVVYDETANDEPEWEDDEDFVEVDDGLTYEGLIGIYETNASGARTIHISTHLQKIKLSTTADPIIS